MPLCCHVFDLLPLRVADNMLTTWAVGSNLYSILPKCPLRIEWDKRRASLLLRVGAKKDKQFLALYPEQHEWQASMNTLLGHWGILLDHDWARLCVVGSPVVSLIARGFTMGFNNMERRQLLFTFFQ